MSSLLRTSSLLGWLVALGGCVLQNVSAEQALGDAVHELNDGTRWHRGALVARHVADDYRDRFLRRHRGWGHTLRVADVEVLESRLDDGSMDAAESLVVIRWYDTSTMLLRESTIRQRWRRDEPARHYRLVGESIVEGDPRLFDEPQAATGSGGEAPGPLAAR